MLTGPAWRSKEAITNLHVANFVEILVVAWSVV